MRIGNHRGIHVIMRSDRAQTRVHIPLRAQGFAAGLSSRYRPGSMGLSPSAMPLLIGQSGGSTMIIQQRYHLWPIHQTARMQLTVLLQRTSRLMLAKSREAMTMPAGSRAPIEQPQQEALPRLQGGAVVEHLLQQHQRVETRLTPAVISRALRPEAGSPVATAVTAPTGMVEMALVRPAASAAATVERPATEPSVTTSGAMSSDTSRATAHGSLKQASLATAKLAEMNEREVEQLAERVIRSIDKRIVAQRERLGRL